MLASYKVRLKLSHFCTLPLLLACGDRHLSPCYFLSRRQVPFDDEMKRCPARMFLFLQHFLSSLVFPSPSLRLLAEGEWTVVFRLSVFALSDRGPVHGATGSKSEVFGWCWHSNVRIQSLLAETTAFTLWLETRLQFWTIVCPISLSVPDETTFRIQENTGSSTSCLLLASFVFVWGCIIDISFFLFFFSLSFFKFVFAVVVLFVLFYQGRKCCQRSK